MAKNIYIFFFKFQIDSKGLETHSLRRKANARNVSFETLYLGQFTLSTHLIKPEKKKCWVHFIWSTRQIFTTEIIFNKLGWK